MTKDTDKQTLSVTVSSSKGAFGADFQKTATVADVIAAAIDTQGLGGSADSFEVFLGDEPLTPTNRPLVSFHVKDGDVLLVAPQGEGV